MDDGVDDETARAATSDASYALRVRRRAVSTLIEQAAALAREGFFIESSALMTAARGLMNAVATDATVVALGAVRATRES